MKLTVFFECTWSSVLTLGHPGFSLAELARSTRAGSSEPRQPTRSAFERFNGALTMPPLATDTSLVQPNKWLERTSLRRHGSCVVWQATAPPPALAAQPHRSAC
jgi:hypothetical protein